MIIGILIGFSVGITLTTVMWSIMLVKGGKRRAENDKIVEALLVRKAEGIERIASIMENNSNVTCDLRENQTSGMKIVRFTA